MKKSILILHGWGISGKKYQDLVALLKKEKFIVYAPDFPGFGSEKLSKSVMNLADYVDFTFTFIKKHKLQKPIIIGHSFGGRVATKLAYQYPSLVSTIVITGSPLIKKKLSHKKKLAQFLAKTYSQVFAFVPASYSKQLKKLLYRTIGEWDYYKAEQLRETFKQIIAEDQSVLLPKVKTKTILVWGENDSMVPVKDGKHIASLLPNATFISIPDSFHNVPYAQPELFYNAIKKYL